MPRTNHTSQIQGLRNWATTEGDRPKRLAMETAADLLELHDQTGISLDTWVAARELVEYWIDETITPNHV